MTLKCKGKERCQPRSETWCCREGMPHHLMPTQSNRSYSELDKVGISSLRNWVQRKQFLLLYLCVKCTWEYSKLYFSAVSTASSSLVGDEEAMDLSSTGDAPSNWGDEPRSISVSWKQATSSIQVALLSGKPLDASVASAVQSSSLHLWFWHTSCIKVGPLADNPGTCPGAAGVTSCGLVTFSWALLRPDPEANFWSNSPFSLISLSLCSITRWSWSLSW